MHRRTTKTTMLHTAITLLAAAVAPATARAQSAFFSGIGFLHEEERWSWVFGLSSDGTSVIGASRDGDGFNGPVQAIRWRPETGIEGIGRLPGTGKNSQAFGVSTNGSVIVGAGNSDPGWQAFRWTEAGGIVGLGDLPGGDFWSQAWAVSGDGSIVVGLSRGGGRATDAPRPSAGPNRPAWSDSDSCPAARTRAVPHRGYPRTAT